MIFDGSLAMDRLLGNRLARNSNIRFAFWEYGQQTNNLVYGFFVMFNRLHVFWVRGWYKLQFPHGKVG